MVEEHASLERGGHVPASPFRLFDSDGGLLVLRPDITLAKEFLGWEPRIPLAEGLPKTIEYFKRFV